MRELRPGKRLAVRDTRFGNLTVLRRIAGEHPVRLRTRLASLGQTATSRLFGGVLMIRFGPARQIEAKA